MEAAESLFVPVFVSNNTPGPDRAVLERFGEPTWNNPAVRFLSPAEEPVAPRLYGDWTAAALADHLVDALDGRAPAWLVLVADEERARARGTEARQYAMGCFWQGESALGAVPGVVATRTGFAGGREVVELQVDPDRLDRVALEAAAARVGAVPSTGALRPSPADDRHALGGTTWTLVPMTPAQATRVNAAVAAGQDPRRWLSPRQLAIADAVAADPGHAWPTPGPDLRASIAAIAPRR